MKAKPFYSEKESGIGMTSGLFFTMQCCIVMLLFLSSCGVPAASVADMRNFQENEPEYRNRYDVTFEENEKPQRYGYHYVVSKMPGSYRVRVFHPEKKVLTEDNQYSTDALTLLHGPSQRFWDDGSIRDQGMYQYGRKHGVWLECEPGKGKSTSGLYHNNRKEGEWTQLDTNGMVESIYTWHDDRLYGKFFLFDVDGKKVNEGLYRRDTLIAELFPRSPTQKPLLRECVEPVTGSPVACTEYVLQENLYAHLKYPQPARANKIEGTAYVQWDVLPDGSISHVRVPQALCNDIEEECLRVFKNMPPWRPAMKSNQPIKYTLSLPIKFSL